MLQVQEVQMVVWLLRHCLLMQLHTYVFLVPGKHSSSDSAGTQAPAMHNGLHHPPFDEALHGLKAPSVPDTASGQSKNKGAYKRGGCVA